MLIIIFSSHHNSSKISVYTVATLYFETRPQLNQFQLTAKLISYILTHMISELRIVFEQFCFFVFFLREML